MLIHDFNPLFDDHQHLWGIQGSGLMWWWIKALVGPLFWGRWTPASSTATLVMFRSWQHGTPSCEEKTEDWKSATTIWIDSGHYLQQGKHNLISATWLGNWSRFIWFHGRFKFKQWRSNHGKRLCFMAPILLDSNSPRAKGCTPRKPHNWSLQSPWVSTTCSEFIEASSIYHETKL